MAKQIGLEWERIGQSEFRAKVFGGWLIKTYEEVMHHLPDRGGLENGWDWRPALAFVPDPGHEWDIEIFN